MAVAIGRKSENMYVENVKSQMRKGMLEYSIMLLLRVKPCYSSDIIDELEHANLIVVEGTLYPLLNRLKKEGILDYEWQESSAGPPRKYYRLTEAGLQALAQLDESWCNLLSTVAHIKEKNNTLPQ
jgi:PadR family transcriptional regulator PadR